MRRVPQVLAPLLVHGATAAADDDVLKVIAGGPRAHWMRVCVVHTPYTHFHKEIPMHVVLLYHYAWNAHPLLVVVHLYTNAAIII